MSRRLALIGMTGVLALALAVPALGGPSNPIAEVAGIKQDVKKALKQAKQAKKKARNAVRASREALLASQRAQNAADQAQGQANSATRLAQDAQSLGAEAIETASNAKAQADLNVTAIAAAQSTANTAISKADLARSRADANTQKLGCPFGGSTRSSGICMNDSLRAADGYFDAQDDCEDEGRFLPSVGDLMHYLHKTDQDPGTSATPEEWTYERFASGTSETVALISGYPQHTTAATGTNLPYRCVTHANG